VQEESRTDLNIWLEPDGDEYLVYMEDDKKQIKAATLNKLVVKMTSDTEFGMCERWSMPLALSTCATWS
jgi:hypothetical protein